MVKNIQDLAAVPVRVGAEGAVFLRDVGEVSDGSDLVTSIALVNGRRTVYMPVTKRSDASTLTVVELVKANLPKFKAACPDDINVTFEFDQSPWIQRAIMDLAKEGLLGAALTGLMVLLFLRDIRSAVIVVLNIPISIAAAVVGLWVSGQTINLMTLGGLALGYALSDDLDLDDLGVELVEVDGTGCGLGVLGQHGRGGGLHGLAFPDVWDRRWHGRFSPLRGVRWPHRGTGWGRADELHDEVADVNTVVGSDDPGRGDALLVHVGPVRALQIDDYELLFLHDDAGVSLRDVALRKDDVVAADAADRELFFVEREPALGTALLNHQDREHALPRLPAFYRLSIRHSRRSSSDNDAPAPQIRRLFPA